VKYNDEMPHEERLVVRQRIWDHTEVLRELVSSTAEQARKYLTLTNAGAIVALLTYMNARPSIRSSTTAWVCLAIFSAGLILVGVLAAIDYRLQTSQMLSWVEDSGRFFRNEIDQEHLYGELNARNRRGRWSAAAGYLSFLCFIAGSATAMVTLVASGGASRIGGYYVVGAAPWCLLDNGLSTIDCGYYSETHCNVSEGGIKRTFPETVFCVPRPE
jgi:hypothetical protein